MELSKHVLPMTIDGKDYYLESIHQKLLPADSNIELLRTHFFLAGQEDESLHDKLLTRYTTLKLVIIPTWECNLRCTHCCVADKLIQNDQTDFDVNKFKEFIKRYLDKYITSKITVLFCGGEPLLKSNSINEVVSVIKSLNVEYEFSVTTNLTKDLTDIDFDALAQMSTITVSIDGLELQHNQQRKSLTDINPYQKTLQNLKKLMLNGLREKIIVQSTRGSDTREEKKLFAKEMLRYGVLRDKINIGLLHPTRNRPNSTECFVNHMKQQSNRHLWLLPCCKYQHMCHMLIDNNGHIYTDFYVRDYLGTMDDDIDLICQRSKDSIFKEMPCLHDPTCRSCPVLGLCWGRCAQCNFTDKKPSELCDVDGLIKLANAKAKMFFS